MLIVYHSRDHVQLCVALLGENGTAIEPAAIDRAEFFMRQRKRNQAFAVDVSALVLEMSATQRF